MLGAMNAPDTHRIARVVVDVPTRALTEPFDYTVPAALDAAAVVGAPVIVPFGGQRVVGYVVERAGTSAFDGQLRGIDGVLGEPLFGMHAPSLAAWIAHEYVCPLADAMRLFLPPGGSPSAVAVYAVAGERPRGAVQAAVWQCVSDAGELAASDLRGIDARYPATAATLARSGVLRREWRLKPAAVGAVDDRWACRVAGVAFEPSKRATAQRALLDALADGPVRVAELAAELGAVDGPLRALVSAGALTVERRRRMRLPHIPERSAPRHAALTAGQQSALEAIASGEPGSCLLLDGVTGSGKTEVYLRAIEEVVASGGSAIVLVPEISLTPQTVGRFRSRFGDLVAVLHSRLSAGERYDQWDRVRSGDARVVVGPRSALFAPARDLRLIVIDEEHDASYKQGSAPRYHARSVAARLARATGATLVLGSATPSFESRHAADAGRIGVVRLPDRVGGAVLPEVRVVDMAEEFRDGHRSMFSRPLVESLQEVESRGQKAVLFINRRGFASFVLCRECGFVPRCDHCSVALTYHEVGHRLVCHHCGATRQLPVTCPKCGSPYLRQFGTGTQRVEAEIASLVPGLPIVRMDADTTAGKGGHEKRLAEFEALEAGVLLGTQMVAKGLDYPEVVLVGVVNADTTLHMPDFRSAERTYQLLEQVSGRAGRGDVPGRVIIQTYWPEHPAIVAAATHAADAFYRDELATRTALSYPPEWRLTRVVASGRVQSDVRDHIERLAQALRAAKSPDMLVLGPAPAPLARVKSAFRWHLLLKGPHGSRLADVLWAALEATPPTEGVSVAPDVDPYDMM